MWFYFSGSGLEQQTGAQRRDSRSGSGGDLHKITSGGGETSGIEHRKSAAGQQEKAQRRESRSKDSGAGLQPPSQKEPKQRKSVAAPSAGGAASGAGATTTHRHSSAQHRGSTISEMASSAIQSTATILANILRALIVRALLMAHSMICIWAAAENHADNSVWAFALVAFCLVGEGFYAIIVRAGDEPRWFSPAIAVYLLSTAPPLWLLQSSLCELRISISANISSSSTFSHPLHIHPTNFGLNPSSFNENGFILPQLLTYTLFLVLLFARWLLPRLELSREELTQILLAYMAIMTDILEFLGLLNSPAICAEPSLRNAVLAVFTLSLFQFTLIFTASRSRKMRIAVATKILLSTNRPDIRQAFFDLDIWAILISLTCQDIPFIVLRFCLLGWFWNVEFVSLAFITKNALIILIQTYRVSVLLNDRYKNPEISTRSLLNEKRHSIALPTGMTLNQHQQHKLSRAVPLKEKETAMLGGGAGNNENDK